jgi:hypothetical protein
MFSIAITRRLAAALLLSANATACKESTDPGENEPEVASIRLTVGASTVTIAENGAVTGGPLRITTADQPLTASFLKADGSVESLVTSSEFRLDVTGGTGVTFARTGPFAGTIRGSAATTSTVTVSLFHLIENHADFGPFTVPVQVP